MKRPQFVDYFCGIGGASTGAMNAGYEVVLAVDSWQKALSVHERNHPHSTHVCTMLPSAEPLHLPPAGTEWHLHGSPPCTLLSKAANRTRTDGEREQGLELVRWFVDFALASDATTWSMEQVAVTAVTDLLKAYQSRKTANFDWDVFDLACFGVPQYRRRVLAGSPSLIAKMRARSMTPRRKTPKDVFKSPRGTHIRNNVQNGTKLKPGELGKRRFYTADQCCRPLSETSYTVCAAQPLFWATPGSGKELEWLTADESLRLQAFPDGYQLGYLSKHAAQKGVGNALPPPVMAQMLGDNRPVSPSIMWRASVARR